MAILSDISIEKTHYKMTKKSRNWMGLIEPWSNLQLQPASYDLRFGGEILKDDKKYYGDTFYIEPGEFLLGTTLEVLNIPDNLAARFEGKSSLGRLGLMTHITAGFIDPGFQGELTLELYNVSRKRITLLSGMSIGQICFFTLDRRVRNNYEEKGGHYHGQKGATPHYYWKDEGPVE